MFSVMLPPTANSTKVKKVVIAHRGASGYLPENTLEAKAMAFAMGVDYIEQDLVMTQDDELIVLHDRYLDKVTNVAEVFPNRKREDGHYYVIDFTLAEIRQLQASEAFLKDGNTCKAKYPRRFPIRQGNFRIHTFQEELDLIQGLNKSTGKNVGIYPEIKVPWFHRKNGKDISIKTIEVLKEYGYTTRSHPVILQCFDPNELELIYDHLLKEAGIQVRLGQLIAENTWEETLVFQGDKWVCYDYSWMHEKGAMKKIARYANSIGPWYPQLIETIRKDGTVKFNHTVREAHAEGMVVYPFTFRADEGQIPEYAKDFEEYLDLFLNKAGVDGVFTDFPDKVVHFVRVGSKVSQ